MSDLCCTEKTVSCFIYGWLKVLLLLLLLSWEQNVISATFLPPVCVFLWHKSVLIKQAKAVELKLFFEMWNVSFQWNGGLQNLFLLLILFVSHFSSRHSGPCLHAFLSLRVVSVLGFTESNLLCLNSYLHYIYEKSRKGFHVNHINKHSETNTWAGPTNLTQGTLICLLTV